DEGERRLHEPARRAGGVGAGPPEMPGVKAPERLNRRIERAAGERRVTLRLAEEAHEVERRGVERAVAIETDERRVGAIKAEDPLEPLDLGERAGDQPVRDGRL